MSITEGFVSKIINLIHGISCIIILKYLSNLIVPTLIRYNYIPKAFRILKFQISHNILRWKCLIGQQCHASTSTLNANIFVQYFVCLWI